MTYHLRKPAAAQIGLVRFEGGSSAELHFNQLEKIRFAQGFVDKWIFTMNIGFDEQGACTIIQHVHAEPSTTENLNIDLDNFKIHFLQSCNRSTRAPFNATLAVFSIRSV